MRPWVTTTGPIRPASSSRGSRSRLPRLPSLDALWESTPPGDRRLTDAHLAKLPRTARRYLSHAIAPDTTLARAVRLRMHGEIRLGRWWPFQAEEVIRADRGLVWCAAISMGGVPVRGADELLDGQGRMQWKLFGVIPVIHAHGPDITRSAAGRLAAESVWLPSMLAGEDALWSIIDESRVRVRLLAGEELAAVELSLGPTGALRQVMLQRWGNPGGGPFRSLRFGALVEDEATFGGYTIPTRLRVGWHIGTDRFEPEGEFLRVTVDEARHRP
jgi:hypothetical protein